MINFLSSTHVKMVVCWTPTATSIITGRNEVVANVMFLHVCVILFTGGGGCLRRTTPSRDQADTPRRPMRTPPGPGRPPTTNENPPSEDQGEPPGTRENPPGTRENPPTKENPPRTRENPPRPGRTPPEPGRHPPGTRDTPPERTLQYTVNERPVRILLECILVSRLSTRIFY